MKLAGKIKIEDPEGLIYKSVCIEKEEKFKGERSLVRYEWDGKCMIVEIFSRDVTAFRASIDGLLRYLKAIESIENEI